MRGGGRGGMEAKDNDNNDRYSGHIASQPSEWQLTAKTTHVPKREAGNISNFLTHNGNNMIVWAILRSMEAGRQEITRTWTISSLQPRITQRQGWRAKNMKLALSKFQIGSIVVYEGTVLEASKQRGDDRRSAYISPTTEKLESFLNFLTPTSKKDIQSIMWNFSSKF